MTYKLCVLTAFLILNQISYSQSAYYAVNDIYKNYVDINGDIFSFKTDSNSVKKISEYLREYLPDSLKKKKLSAEQIFSLYARNPFIGAHAARLIGGSQPFFPGAVSKIATSIGGLNVTNFADGLAKFLVKRFKEELTIAFFQKFKDEIGKSVELQTLFPETFKVLLVIDKDIYKFSAYLNTLRETFIKDLTNLYVGFKKFTKLDKYKRYFAEHPEINTIVTSSFYFIDQYAAGVHAGDVLARYDTADLKFRNSSLEHNIRSSIALTQALSLSFKSLSEDHYWVPADSVRMLLNNSNTVSRNLYFGLIYQKNGNITFTAKGNDELRLDTLLAKAQRFSDSLSEYVNFIHTMMDHAQEVNEYLSELKSKQKSEIDYNDYYKLYNASLDLIEHAFTFSDLPFINLDEQIKENLEFEAHRWLFVARSSGNLYVDIRTKNYSSAILNGAGIIDTILINYGSKPFLDSLLTQVSAISNRLNERKKNLKDTVSTTNRKMTKTIANFYKNVDLSYADLVKALGQIGITDKSLINSIDSIIKIKRILYSSQSNSHLSKVLLKYGTFAAAVAQAQNSDEVEKAIESIVLPAGSASIKKNSCFNISLNAYLGFFYGSEYLKDNPGKKSSSITGIYAPVGVSFSWGLNKGKAGSVSLFGSLIDIGAFASFRLKDDTTKALPEVSLKNIFAPGAGIIYGIPNLPISIGWTWQYGPMIREIKETSINASDRLNHRWQFFVAVDIPLVNFYTRSRSD